MEHRKKIETLEFICETGQCPKDSVYINNLPCENCPLENYKSKFHCDSTITEAKYAAGVALDDLKKERIEKIEAISSYMIKK